MLGIKCNYLLFLGVVIGESIKSSLITPELLGLNLGVEFETGLTLDEDDINNGELLISIPSNKTDSNSSYYNLLEYKSKSVFFIPNGP